MHKNRKKSSSSSSSSSEEAENYKKNKNIKKKKNKQDKSSSSSVSSDSNHKPNSAQHRKSEIVTRAAVEEKVKDLRKLLNNSNNILIKKEQEIKNILTFLRNNKCEVSAKIIKNQPPPKVCAFCNNLIDENYKFDRLVCCPNKFVHKSCILNESVKLSPDLKESELNYRLSCKACQKSLPFEFLREFLQDEIREIKNRKKPCINCEELKPQNELIKKSCDHYYCEGCLKKLLYDLVIAPEINYSSIKCRSKACDALLFKENDFKTQFREKYYKADDYYARITEIKKNEILKRCVGREDCPRFITNSPKPAYICLDCENKIKKGNNEKKEEEEKVANPPPVQE